MSIIHPDNINDWIKKYIEDIKKETKNQTGRSRVLKKTMDIYQETAAAAKKQTQEGHDWNVKARMLIERAKTHD